MKNQMWAYARRFLHAFAEAGSLPSAQEVGPLMGPNGAVMRAEVAPIGPGQPHFDDRLPTAEGLVVPTTSQPRMDIRMPEPTSNTLEAPAI
jgi:hypothetical protein